MTGKTALCVKALQRFQASLFSPTRTESKRRSLAPKQPGTHLFLIPPVSCCLAAGLRNLAVTLENLRQITDNLRDLTEDAKRYPSNLFLGEPPPKPERVR